jgi:hypothetical protein
MSQIFCSFFKELKIRIPNIIFSIIDEFDTSKNTTDESTKLFSESLVSIAQHLGNIHIYFKKHSYYSYL